MIITAKVISHTFKGNKEIKKKERKKKKGVEVGLGQII